MSDPRSEKAESDVESDPNVAGSRVDEDGENPDSGPYVGRIGSDDDIDAEESGAEARAKTE
ncbi:hypothetical protein [Mycobacterium sp. SMC-4]|uniref:hypothetical protein n=1 Tax=Mycobacterium sp. SMC-4 TaxID=2857059 RepID=UPI0021B1A409|nr:hypothetical protein [Mycobacterium sp. SMC-4]UXA17099.1 hypothetical protein KXD98_20475 [Mycobacterium sp. SMC-4]